ncbi:MAG: hypothetical protein ACI4OS_06745 [Akkermansia sp.]
MNRIARLSTLLALVGATPAVLADISAAVPAAPANMQARANCDLLAANTVSATFVGLHDLTVQGVNDAAPVTVPVAVFEVIQPLAYKQYNRLGDGPLTTGTKFTVAMNKQLPGQPASIVDTIAQMQPGEEAVLRIDHLYLINGQQGEPIRACSRMARRQAQPAVAPTAAPAQPAPDAAAAPAPLPTTTTPLGSAATTGSGMQFSAQSESVSITRDAAGNVMQVRSISRFNPTTGQMETRKFINGTEVNPQTDEPLAPAAAAAPAPAPAPAAPAPEEKPADGTDDTVVDRGADQAPVPAPQPTAAPAAPAAATPQPTAPAAQQPAATSEEEGF